MMQVLTVSFTHFPLKRSSCKTLIFDEFIIGSHVSSIQHNPAFDSFLLFCVTDLLLRFGIDVGFLATFLCNIS